MAAERASGCKNVCQISWANGQNELYTGSGGPGISMSTTSVGQHDTSKNYAIAVGDADEMRGKVCDEKER